MRAGFLTIVLLVSIINKAKTVHFNYPTLHSNVDRVTKKLVALTFDDGPSPLTTPKILEVLKQFGVKATFFMLGKQVQRYPHLVKAVMQQGHEIGNHTYSHPILSHKSLSQIQEELQKTQRLLEGLGIQARWFRPPYGITNKAIEKVSASLGLKEILWTVDSKDWRLKTRLMPQIERDLRPGAVILMHDTQQVTSNNLSLILNNLKDKGYTFVTLSEWQNYLH